MACVPDKLGYSLIIATNLLFSLHVHAEAPDPQSAATSPTNTTTNTDVPPICFAAIPPTSLPDGKHATKQQMAAAQSLVKAFIAQSDSYIRCVDDSEVELSAIVPKGQELEARRVALNARNRAVEREESIAACWNKQLQDFRATGGGRGGGDLYCAVPPALDAPTPEQYQGQAGLSVPAPSGQSTWKSLMTLSSFLVTSHNPQDCLAVAKKALDIAESQKPEDPAQMIQTYLVLTTCYENLEDWSSAASYLGKVFDIQERQLGSNDLKLAYNLDALARIYQKGQLFAEAAGAAEKALQIRKIAFGPDDRSVGVSLSTLGYIYFAAHQYDKAESAFVHSLAIAEKSPIMFDAPAAIGSLAYFYQVQGRYSEAEPLYLRALTAYERDPIFGPDNSLTIRENLGVLYKSQMRFDAATGNLRIACAHYRSRKALSGTQHVPSGNIEIPRSNKCSAAYALSLWGWSARGGGSAPSDRPDKLMLEAFQESQRAVLSAAGDALSRSAALAVAKSSGVGTYAESYESALSNRDKLDEEFKLEAAAANSAHSERLLSLARTRDEASKKIQELEAHIKKEVPLYWDYRSPEPVDISALQATKGPDAVLLHKDEALILFLVVPGKDNGLVFAVNKQRAAWAWIGLTGEELTQRVERLRAQIDPHGYELRSVAHVRKRGTDEDFVPGAFDRKAAYELYLALLGDASIQAVIRDKPVLLFVPSGPLTALPPGLLVTAPPAGGAAGDEDPGALRTTPWLLRSKAVAVLPAVSSLRTLRQIRPANRASTPDPLLVFADPKFSNPANSPKTTDATIGAVRSIGFYFRGSSPIGDALDRLPPLPGTRREAEALEKALNGRPGSLLTGSDASKAQLMTRNADGRLAQVRILEFATHGLVVGDVADLTEPALVLAAGATPADELLLASEAATLKLNADWVLLSACNTASPDAPEAQGLSGLSRAFFYAGAKSLLVSHWTLRDDVAPKLIPAMLLAERENQNISHAQALRQASLSILDDPTLDAANPSAWATFVLIGEPER
jgi:CHAT domain-containing protein